WLRQAGCTTARSGLVTLRRAGCTGSGSVPFVFFCCYCCCRASVCVCVCVHAPGGQAYYSHPFPPSIWDADCSRDSEKAAMLWIQSQTSVFGWHVSLLQSTNTETILKIYALPRAAKRHARSARADMLVK